MRICSSYPACQCGEDCPLTREPSCAPELSVEIAFVCAVGAVFALLTPAAIAWLQSLLDAAYALRN